MKNYKITNLRILAIFMVVLGHSMVLYSSGWGLYETTVSSPFFDNMKKVINIIQMPLFFSLSGYLFYYSMKKELQFCSFFMDKCKRLLVPYVCIAFLWLVPIKLIVKYPGYQGISIIKLILGKIIQGTDNGHLWFLAALFTIFIIMYVLITVAKKVEHDAVYWIIFAGLIVVSILSNKLPYFIPYLNSAVQYAMWFYMGYILNKYQAYLPKSKVIQLFIAVLSIGLILFAVKMGQNRYDYLAGLFTVVSLYIFMPTKSNPIIGKLEKNSFGVYLFHSPLIYISFTYYKDINPFLMVFINFFLWGTVAFFVTSLVRKIGLKFMLGEK